MRQFEADPTNQDILSKIKTLREILIEYPDINRTAYLEQVKQSEEEAGLTSTQSAYHELDRLFTLYETCNILRSVQCRIGNVACPLGHFAAFFDDFKTIQDGKQPIHCNICDKVAKDGYHCGYCFYSLCIPCSVIYCCHGHSMKLWTHPESQHACVVCLKQPIYRGYRCTLCPDDYNICDYCTRKEGRAAVQHVIMDNMKELLGNLRASPT